MQRLPISDKDIIDYLAQGNSIRQTAHFFNTSRATIRARRDRYHAGSQATKPVKVQIKGIIPAQDISGEEILNNLISRQSKKEQKIELSRQQRVIIDEDKPFVIALFADTHMGNNKADYRALKEDTQVVKDCPFCYCITAGDYTDNWIGKLGYIAREQEITHVQEQALAKWWFGEISDSLIACCAGNHDNRTILQSGVDYIREICGDIVMLYDQDQILFTLELPESEIKFKVRHKDQYKSVMNPFHGGFRDLERGDADWDVYISGHDHKATLFGENIFHDRKVVVCRLGTYKMDDRFGKFLGFARSYGNGSGALVVHPNGCLNCFSSIHNAIDYAEMLR